ncbi:spore coat protein [Domibacillus epiphyticus]|uniref:Spore coat protein n=1 Tax=Domibacillus epiphyticus TaxID=1714355 RepID=A0A1V2A5S8_9BACI|nr:spore coat protein [Domibacillus epiphyticus]OMP66365.1 spore coat protein [Domibacillus epiphyticus]
MAKKLAMHETLEVHEVLLFKTSCITKSMAIADQVEDRKLKKMLQEDIKSSKKAIKDLRTNLEKEKG